MSETAQIIQTVTIIIPTIGRPEYVVDTVRSALAQDYKHFKILISDNAPAKPTSEVLAEAGVHDDRISFISRPSRLEFALHMNACLTDADGEFVMILSDDDQLSSGYVTEMVSLFSADPLISVAFGEQQVISEHDKGLISCKNSNSGPRIFEGLEFLLGTLSGELKTNVLTYVSLFAKRSELLLLGGFKDYPYGAHSDNILLWKLALQGRVAVGQSKMLYRIYLASSGLGLPFSDLLEATSTYTLDCANLLRLDSKVKPDLKRKLIHNLRKNNFQMLVNRTRSIYRKRVSLPRLAVYLAAAIKYYWSPVGRL